MRSAKERRAVLESADIVLQRLELILGTERARRLRHRFEHIVERVQIAIDLESGRKILGRGLEFGDKLGQRGLQVALDGFHVPLGLAFAVRVRLPFFNAQLGQIHLRRLRSVFQLREQQVQLIDGRI